MKNILERTSGYWCLEYDCWPEDHPGCSSRDEEGCNKCSKSIYTIVAGKKDGIELPEQEILQ
jgi:hypothetical protein